MKKLLPILFIFTFCLFTKLQAQTDTVINGKHYKIVEEKNELDQGEQMLKQKKHVAPLDSMFVIEGKKMKYYNSWITAGGGIQQNLTYKRTYGFAGGLDFNFHLKQHYFQLGTTITGEKFGSYDNYQFHLGYGKRVEDNVFHAAVFGGISLSTGYTKDSSGIYQVPYTTPGIYIEGQLIKKIAYDVGAGISIFGDYNKEQAIVGGRIILFFSGAYKGKKNDQLRVK